MNVKQELGDATLLKAVRYESAVRSQWLLGLRATNNRMSVATGEDARIARDNGDAIFRQVKKREGAQWSASSLQSVIRAAWERFAAEPRVTNEFFTNAPISKDLRGKALGPNRFLLNPAAPQVSALAQHNAAAFAESLSSPWRKSFSPLCGQGRDGGGHVGGSHDVVDPAVHLDAKCQLDS